MEMISVLVLETRRGEGASLEKHPWPAGILEQGLAATTLPLHTEWGGHRANTSAICHPADPSTQGEWPLHLLFQCLKVGGGSSLLPPASGTSPRHVPWHIIAL